MNLTKFQINAVRSMARGLAPLQRKLDRIHAKEVAFLESISSEKQEIQQQIDQINSAIVTYTGGYTVDEVLHPETTLPEAPIGEADENAQVEMTEIIPETTTVEVPAEVFNESIPAEVIAEEVVAESVVEEPAVTAEEEVPFWDRPRQ